ncbi:MAG: dockerin type I domain-containing protein [Euryarchaeota archaeon]|nr:dockerin type I domain-containing protein [Euryarchaeota archaeon]
MKTKALSVLIMVVMSILLVTIVMVQADTAPTIISYTISNRTITPPQATGIDVEFSETVAYCIAIEKDTATIYDWTGTAKNPSAKTWAGTYETNGTVVPAGVYTVNVTGTNTTTNLSVVNNTETITVLMNVISIGTVVGNKTVSISIDNASNIGSADINVTYNSSVCVITEATNGSFDITSANLEQNETGWVRISAFQAENPGLTGSIILANITFQSNGTSGTSTLNLTVNKLTGATPECNDISYIVVNGTYLTFLNGDVNDDGEVTLSDAMYLAKHVIGITGFEDIVEAAADVNGNGEIEISDAMYLAKHVLGIPGFEELK